MEKISMLELIEELRTRPHDHGRYMTYWEPGDFPRVLAALLGHDLSENALGTLAWQTCCGHPDVAELSVDEAQIPADRKLFVARALSGTADADLYETIVSLLEGGLVNEKRLENLNFAQSFTSRPDPVGAKRIADRLLQQVGRYRTVLSILATWQNLGVVTEEQSASIVKAVLARPNNSVLVSKLSKDVVIPWMMNNVRSRNAWVAAAAVSNLHRLDHEVPTEILAPFFETSIGLGVLLAEVGDEGVRELADQSLPANTLAKAAMASHYMCEVGLMDEWELGGPDLEIEQIGVVDGKSVETAGLIFVFRYRFPEFDENDWVIGVSGPYSLGKRGHDLGGLDFTNGQLDPEEGTLEEQVSDLLGVPLMFSSLAVKPKLSAARTALIRFSSFRHGFFESS